MLSYTQLVGVKLEQKNIHQRNVWDQKQGVLEGMAHVDPCQKVDAKQKGLEEKAITQSHHLILHR